MKRTEKTNRKEYLTEFIENVDIIFSEKNLNKVEALYGKASRVAIENAIYAMKTGSNSPNQSGDGITNSWLKWVNNSIGTIMFFNRRSALLQLTSTTKFLLFLPEKQYHEIGLLYAHYLIRKSGVQSVYLGSSVPLSDVKICSEKIKPTHILCSFTIPLAKDKMSLYLRKTSNLFKDNNVLVHNASIDKLTKRSHPYLSFLSTIEDLKKILLRSIDFESVEGLKLQCKDS